MVANSACIDGTLGWKVATMPTRPPSDSASANIASFGFSTGRGAWSAAAASIAGPKAEQVNRMASAPQSTV